MGVEHFLHVSALGADSESNVRWLATKGKVRKGGTEGRRDGGTEGEEEVYARMRGLARPTHIFVPPSLPPSHPSNQAYEVASLSQRDVQTSDFIFLIRKDVRRYKRMKDLLEADEELRDARDPKVKKLTET